MARRSAARPEAPLPAALAIPAELTIYTVGELHPRWIAWLGECAAHPPRADGAAVSEVDSAGLQMLLALDRAVAERGGHLVIDAPSSALSAGCAAVGLSGWLAERSAVAAPP
jgi:ABC-type transporter Mla MlaB component